MAKSKEIVGVEDTVWQTISDHYMTEDGSFDQEKITSAIRDVMNIATEIVNEAGYENLLGFKKPVRSSSGVRRLYSAPPLYKKK